MKVKTIIIAIILAGACWHCGVRPLIAGIYFLKHTMAVQKTFAIGNEIKKATKENRLEDVARLRPDSQKQVELAEYYIEKALRYDPDSSEMLMEASRIHSLQSKHIEAFDYMEKMISSLNGDLTAWSVWAYKASLKYKTGELYQAKSAYETSLWYYPLYVPAIKQYGRICKTIDIKESMAMQQRNRQYETISKK